MKQLKEYFLDRKVNKVLDVGTGSGDFLAVLKEAMAGSQITGIDPNEESLKVAAKKYPDVKFQKMTGEDIKFADNSFDVVSISMALHHLPDVQITLKEMQRVVKNGSWIIVSELFSDNLNPAQEVHKMFHHFRSQTDRIRGVSHNETFTKDQIIQLVKDSGINIETYFEFNRGINLIKNSADLDERIEKMKLMLESVKESSEYETLKPQIEEFRERTSKYGFQPATRVVIIGKVK